MYRPTTCGARALGCTCPHAGPRPAPWRRAVPLCRTAPLPRGRTPAIRAACARPGRDVTTVSHLTHPPPSPKPLTTLAPKPSVRPPLQTVPYAIGQASAFAYCCRQEPRLFKLGQPEVSAHPRPHPCPNVCAPPHYLLPAALPDTLSLTLLFAIEVFCTNCSSAFSPSFLTRFSDPPTRPRQVSWLAKECFVLADKEDATLFQKLNVRPAPAACRDASQSRARRLESGARARGPAATRLRAPAGPPLREAAGLAGRCGACPDPLTPGTHTLTPQNRSRRGW
jgi:hypothetical protein